MTTTERELADILDRLLKLEQVRDDDDAELNAVRHLARNILTRLGVLVLGLLLMLPALAGAQERIIHGTLTQKYRNVVVVVVRNAYNGGVQGYCTGIIVSPWRVLTAAHCMCQGDTRKLGCFTYGTIESQESNGSWTVRDSSLLQVPPGYRFGKRWDVATLDVKTPFNQIPAPLATKKPAQGVPGIIVGFGEYDYEGGFDLERREGFVTVGACEKGVPNGNHVCWHTELNEQDTCRGDSGGPLFTYEDGQLVVAGTTSGGDEPCHGSSFDANVAKYRRWILR